MREPEWRMRNGFVLSYVAQNGDVLGEVLFREPGCYMTNCGDGSMSFDTEETARAYVEKRATVSISCCDETERETVAKIAKWLRTFADMNHPNFGNMDHFVTNTVADMIERGDWK